MSTAVTPPRLTDVGVIPVQHDPARVRHIESPESILLGAQARSVVGDGYVERVVSENPPAEVLDQ